jgi:serine/threonine-protein kinase
MNKDPNYGRLLADRYQIAELVGEGAMGKVYRARDTILGGVTVAIKFLSQALLNENMRERFEREATISALLGEKSIHVVRVRDYGVDQHNIPFYVMEFLSGESLSDLIRYKPLSLSRFLILTRHICLGLDAAHQGIPFNGELSQIIHRDVKPSNIVVLQDPTLGEMAKILDFGIAKLIQTNSSQTQSFMGTLAYCSPEQMEGKELDNRSDIYSLGVMMYEMLTMDMPLLPQNSSFGGWYQAHHTFKPEPFSIKLDLPQKLQDLVFSCLAKEREDRPQNVREILNLLESVTVNPHNSSVANNARNSFPDHSTPTQELEIKTVRSSPSVTEICLQTSWPKDKPISKIVFADLITTTLGETPILSVMLDYQDIINRMSSIRYNQFLYLNHPHPMLLWITLLYHKEHEPRWLPCYLDLKSDKGQELCRALAAIGKYRILFFALDRPQRCQHVVSSTINERNCTMLKRWADMSQLAPGSGNLKKSKQMLKTELEKLKTQILQQVQSSHLTNSQFIPE